MKPQKSKKRRKTKRPRFVGLPLKPPLSKRYCLQCEEMRTFRYNRSVGHSECVKCGCRMAKRTKPEEEENEQCDRKDL